MASEYEEPPQQQQQPPPSSRMNQLYTRHRSILRRLDDLESRLASRVAAHRRRATNLIEEVSTNRRSHMRIFISHRVEGGDDVDEQEEGKEKEATTTTVGAASTAATTPAATPAAGGRPGGKDFSALLHSAAHQHAETTTAPSAVAAAASSEASKKPPHQQQPKKGVRKWTLVVEGGLLIKHLDHMSAKDVDSRLDAGLPILGCNNGIDADDDADEKEATLLQQNKTPEVPLRDQWRGGISQRENETDIPPISFTHLFDKLEVELKIVKQSDNQSAAGGGGNNEPPETSAVTRSGLGAVPYTHTPKPEEAADVKTFTWERINSNNSSPDSNAFFIVHNEESEFKPMGGKVFKTVFKTDHITARVKLYRRQGNEDGNFIPSEQMCGVFFPTFIGKKAAGVIKVKDKSGKSKKRKRDRGGGGDNLLSRATSSSSTVPLENNDASNSSVGSAMIPPGKEAAFASRQQQPERSPGAASSSGAASTAMSAVEHKDVHIPNTVTMDEALHAIFFYIRSRNLQDATDLSIINNDATLSNLFGCSRMLFSAVSGLLIEKQLLVKVQPGTQPIIFNYDMTLDGGEPLTRKQRAKTTGASKSDSAEMTTRRRSTNNDPSDNVVQSDSEQMDVVPHQQTMLSCDADIDVPNLFHVRTRDILRRTKYREFEYTSNRIKALRSLMATKVDEETAKSVLGDVVTGKGYAPHHKQALMAMAKGSHAGGEAHRAAWIDLRTTSLMEKLGEQSSLARGYWDVANACQGLCGGGGKEIARG